MLNTLPYRLSLRRESCNLYCDLFKMLVLVTPHVGLLLPILLSVCVCVCVCVYICLAGAVQSYTWSLTYTVTTSGGSPPHGDSQPPCVRSGAPVPPTTSTTQRTPPIYTHREEHG